MAGIASKTDFVLSDRGTVTSAAGDHLKRAVRLDDARGGPTALGQEHHGPKRQWFTLIGNFASDGRQFWTALSAANRGNRERQQDHEQQQDLERGGRF